MLGICRVCRRLHSEEVTGKEGKIAQASVCFINITRVYKISPSKNTGNCILYLQMVYLFVAEPFTDVITRLKS